MVSTRAPYLDHCCFGFIQTVYQECVIILLSFLFADDTNLSRLGCSRIAIRDDLDNVAAWLNANKLKLNELKTVQLNLKTSASSERFHIASEEI